ncbi:putative protein kinase-like protein [Trypanosoma cruzi]|uniref:Protein kinase domain-containing protein n=1 Tax=Trypanosoma cruzi TaxID=5693 RepID=A0A2V2V569_TRYCR|nr:putative protein kinase-like protein [Trypanosoma cruzi]RNC60802.1 putative protein kinase-like protein [Trypanosoma cruzi]
MLPGLRTLHFVEDVVVDRLRWWRSQHEAMMATTMRSTAHGPRLSSSLSVATEAPRPRAHSALPHGFSTHRRERLLTTLPPRDVLALRHPPMLLFLRGEATAEQRDSVQMALREVEGAVWIARLLPMERVFYSSQIRPEHRDETSGFSPRRKWPRQRASSSPPLPSSSRDFYRVRNKRRGKGGPHNCREDGTAELPNNKEGLALHLVSPSTHVCRKVSCLQDEYVFNPDADFVGDGAFSRVFRAVPLFRGNTSVSFFAIKVIPCRRKKGALMASEAKWRGEKKEQVSKEGAAHEVTVHCKMHGRDVEVSIHGGGGVEYHDALHRELVEIEREISIIRSLRHTGCSQFVEALRTPDEFVIVMNMGRGCMDARRYLQLNGPPSEARVALIIYQLVRTVKYLQYTYGIIHRDIKLENLLLSQIDASQDCIRQVLGTGFATRSRETESTMQDEDEEESIETLEYKENKKDVQKPRNRLASVWGSISSEQSSENFERLLKVTLIDFGLARRTTKLGEKYRSRGFSEGNVGKSQMNSSCSNRFSRVGMPTPLPSAANMFMSVDIESGSGASSSDETPSETTSSSANDDEDDDRNVSYGRINVDDDVDKNEDNGGEEDTEKIHMEVGGDVSKCTTSMTSLLVSTAEPLSLADGAGIAMAEGPGESMLTEFQQKGELETATILNSKEQFITRSCGDSLYRFAPTMPLTAAALQGAGATPSAPFTERGEPNARAWREEGQDDGEMLLFLTPCGTDKYLPPEMLSWIVSYGWKRKLTTLRMARQLDAYAIGIVAYVLLSGCFPFNGASRASMAQQQQRCTPKCNSDHWKHISLEAISFVQSLLEPNPELRSTVAEALKQPWLRRAAKLAEKLSLVPESLEEVPIGGNPSAETCKRQEETPNHLLHVHQQQDATHPGRRSCDISSAVDSGCNSQRSARHDSLIHQSSTTCATPPFLASRADHAGTRTAVAAKNSKEKLHGSSTATAMSDKETGHVAHAFSPPTWSSQVSLSASSPRETAASLLAQISATRKALHGDGDAAGGPSNISIGKAEWTDDSEEESDLFQRIFKTVMSEH